jgi:hypothetical protein
MFLGETERVDLDKVKIEIPAQDARPEADDELQRALGGKGSAGGDRQAPAAPPQSDEERAAAEIQRMLERK